jgi:hypothetical protein
MEKIEIHHAKPGSRDADIVSEVGIDTLIKQGAAELVISNPDGRKLIELFGGGFMENEFHLVSEGTAFLNCRIIEMGSRCVIAYGSARPAIPRAGKDR